MATILAPSTLHLTCLEIRALALQSIFTSATNVYQVSDILRTFSLSVSFLCSFHQHQKFLHLGKNIISTTTPFSYIKLYHYLCRKIDRIIWRERDSHFEHKVSKNKFFPVPGWSWQRYSLNVVLFPLNYVGTTFGEPFGPICRMSPAKVFCQPRLENYELPQMQTKNQIAIVCRNVTQ